MDFTGSKSTESSVWMRSCGESGPFSPRPCSAYLLRGLPQSTWTLGLHTRALPMPFAKTCHWATMWTHSGALSTLWRMNSGKMNLGKRAWKQTRGHLGREFQSQVPKHGVQRAVGLSPRPHRSCVLGAETAPEQGLPKHGAQGRGPSSLGLRMLSPPVPYCETLSLLVHLSAPCFPCLDNGDKDSKE